MSKKTQYMDALKRGGMSYLQKKTLRKKIQEMAKKATTCPNCSAINGIFRNNFTVCVKMMNRGISDTFGSRHR